jgi:hypothetical protein
LDKFVSEFIAEFSQEPPDYLPAKLRKRLEFISCLSAKHDREVWLARDRKSAETVVLKIAQAKAVDAAQREFELLSKLNHPSIPKALHFERDKAGREYLLRSHAPGETLDAVVLRDGHFDERATLEVAQKLCGILSYLHKQDPPVIFRDLKPGNILLTAGGRLSLIDFGISRLAEAGKDFDTNYLGSAGFASPEQYGFAATDPRTDIYALGKLMLWLNTGQTQLPGFREHVKLPGLARLIQRCTQLSPEKRYSSAEKLARAIGRILYPPTRKELVVGALLALFVLAVGFALLYPLLPTVPITGEAPSALQPADGSQAQPDVQRPVEFNVLMEGRPFSDCAVSADNHHWYLPVDGKAVLEVYPNDSYQAAVAWGNQLVTQEISVEPDSGTVTVGVELSAAPKAPEFIPASFVVGTAAAVPLDIQGAETVDVALGSMPAGVGIELRDGSYFLAYNGSAEAQGHFSLVIVAGNSMGDPTGRLSGTADIALGLSVRTDADVVEVATVDDFLGIADDLGGNYRLVADIDLGKLADYRPIGSAQHPFTGSFDGGGHTVSGLKLRAGRNSDLLDWGLFGTVRNGQVTAVRLEAVDVEVSSDNSIGVGAVVGRLEGGSVQGCLVSSGSLRADIAMESSLGAVVGINDNGSVTGCSNAADVVVFTAGSKDRVETYAGGIVGSNRGHLSGCTNSAPVTGITIAGGIAGINDLGVISHCLNTGRVSAPVYMGAYPAGGICHLQLRGRSIRDCGFLEGSAAVGASVWNSGVLQGIVPVTAEQADAWGGSAGQ